MSERKLGAVLEEVKRPVDVVEEEYRILGVRWYAGGAWVKKECAGSEIKATKLYRVKAGDLIYNRLFAWKGSFAVIPQALDGCYVSNEFPAFRVRDGKANIHYIFMLLSQPALWEVIERESAGVASISRKRLKVRDFLELELPLPSRRRQVEILDRYAPLKGEVQELNERVMKSISDVAELHQTILQLAVMGRLVPQDPTDEPASELLKKIHAEKQRLIAEGTIRKPKPLPPIEPDEVAYGLPSGWEWVRLGDATTYGIADKAEPEDITEGTWVLELEDLEKGTSTLLVRKRYPDRSFKSTKNVFGRDDVLYGKLRPYLDKVLVADEPGVCTTEIIPFRGYAGVNSDYLRVALKSPDFVHYANESTHGMNLPRLGTEKARTALIPLPPRAEQKRIVAKVDELMALCDDLEAKLQKAQQDADNLLDAIVHELVSGRNEGSE